MKGREWYQTTEVAQEYEEVRFSRGGRLIDRREKQAVLDALAPIDEKRVLEVACGTGRFTVMLAERGAGITGLDVSGPMLKQGRQKARQVGVSRSLEFIRGDAARIPFPDDYFDAVFAMRFFHLAETPAKFLSEMARVSRGTVFFDTFNGQSARSVYNWLLPMGSHLYSPDRVHRLLADAGLTLASAAHDFIVPYGIYRKLPDPLAARVRQADELVVGTRLGSGLASVSYWDARV